MVKIQQQQQTKDCSEIGANGSGYKGRKEATVR
jgi:hypothetical protein